MIGNVSVNLNKSQSTDFSLQGPRNDKANSETLIFSEESRQKSIPSIPKEPIKLNKGDTNNNHCTSQYQSLSLNSQNKTVNQSSNINQNQNVSSSKSKPLSNTSSRELSLENYKVEKMS